MSGLIPADLPTLGLGELFELNEAADRIAALAKQAGQALADDDLTEAVDKLGELRTAAYRLAHEANGLWVDGTHELVGRQINTEGQARG